MYRPQTLATLLTVALAVAAAADAAAGTAKPAFRPVPPAAVAQDSLIRAGEDHFEHLWQLTFGGQNAEAYWSADGTRLIFQAMAGESKCDQQYEYDLASGKVTRVSDGTGRTTCGYFYDDDRRVLFASTQAGGEACPPDPDMSHGYTWAHLPDLRHLDLPARRQRPAAVHRPPRLRRRGHDVGGRQVAGVHEQAGRRPRSVQDPDGRHGSDAADRQRGL